MSKRFREQVTVTAGGVPPQPPAAFRWRGATYHVIAVLGHWREDAGWWAGGGVAIPQRDLWRVEAASGAAGGGAGAGGRVQAPGVYELVCEEGRWRLDRVWD